MDIRTIDIKVAALLCQVSAYVKYSCISLGAAVYGSVLGEILCHRKAAACKLKGTVLCEGAYYRGSLCPFY